MKTLVVLRHAKSAWPEEVPDHDRPLAPRGRRAAPRAGRWLREAGLRPGRVRCSTALRARQTWELVAGTLGDRPPVTYDPRLYGAEPEELRAVIREEPEATTTLLLVGHNPGLQDLVRAPGKFPTCAIAVLTVPGPWAGLGPDTARLTRVVTPR